MEGIYIYIYIYIKLVKKEQICNSNHDLNSYLSMSTFQ